MEQFNPEKWTGAPLKTKKPAEKQEIGDPASNWREKLGAEIEEIVRVETLLKKKERDQSGKPESLSAPEKLHRSVSGQRAKLLVAFLAFGLALGQAVQEAEGKSQIGSRLGRRGKGEAVRIGAQIGRDMVVSQTQKSARERKLMVQTIGQLRRELRRLEVEFDRGQRQLAEAQKRNQPQRVDEFQERLAQIQIQYRQNLSELKKKESEYRRKIFKDRLTNEVMRTGRRTIMDILR